MKLNAISTAATVLLAVSFAQAAHLVAHDVNSGLWGQADSYIEDADIIVPSSPVADAGSTSCEASNYGSTEYSETQGLMSGEVASVSFLEEGTGTAVIMNSNSACYSNDEGATELWAYGDVSAVVPANTCGIFFTIAPDEGETLGASIRVKLNWYASVEDLSGDAHANVVGAFGDNMIYVMRNVHPPVNELPATGIVWSKDVPEFTEAGYMSETGSFVAQIGDTIGIFMGAHTSVNLVGAGTAAASLSTAIELLAGRPLLEYSYAPGLVYDPDQNITFMKDWSAAGGPMNWDDANEWVQNFTYSNGVLYSNWRLPTTTDDQGVPAGEFGYLYTNYGISENYSGPFTNISAGDYWTAPRTVGDPYYMFTFSTTFGPAQWWHLPSDECYVVPVFDGPPTKFWCPADFDNDGIVDFKDFATFASYWLNKRPEVM